MAVDSVIFLPKKRATVKKNELLRMGGAAFGGTRIAKVEVTTDKGKTWKEARIVKKIDADNVWVFWEKELLFTQRGKYTVNVRATDIHGNVQQEEDPGHYNGANDWPLLRINVKS